MPAKVSKHLVIDTTVVSAAGGEDADYPTSKHCRDFLKAILSICHGVVLTPEIGEEWRRHRSNFARQWLVSMEARKKVRHLGDIVDGNLRGKIERAATNTRDAEAMRKDCRLIEAALVMDRTVVSLDDIVRGLFSLAARSVGELRSVAWINPDKTEEQSVLWLANGAKPEKRRLLGFRAEKEG